MDNINHNIRLDNRKQLYIDGVSDVVSFDDMTVVLDTAGGRLEVNGEGLHIHTLCLENGKVAVEGRIDELIYEDGLQPKRKGLFGRSGNK